MEVLSGPVNEDLMRKRLTTIKSAKFYQTHGACCWEVFKKIKVVDFQAICIETVVDESPANMMLTSQASGACVSGRKPPWPVVAS